MLGFLRPTPRLRPFLLLSICAGLLAPSLHAATIPADSPLIRRIGRFDLADAAGPRCSWSASTVAFTVTGGSVRVKFKDDGNNLWQVVVDGASVSTLTLDIGEQSYPIAEGLAEGRHLIELVKRTEASIGVTQFLGLEIDDTARLLPTAPRAHRIEVIGDSISCGFGNEAPGANHTFSPATENAWLAYGAVAARAVDADYTCIAWSGKKLWPNNSIVDLYAATAPGLRAPAWDYSQWSPEVIVINLGTNDFYGQPAPVPAAWTDAYLKFIARLRSQYPRAEIYCAVGTMLEDRPPSYRPRSTALECLRQVVAKATELGGPAVRLIDFGVQSPANGTGARGHPSVKTHALMGEQLAAALRRDLSW